MRRLGVLLLVVVASGCKCDRRTDPGPGASRSAAARGSASSPLAVPEAPTLEMFVFDFTDDKPTPVLSLWPAEPKAPERKLHQVKADASGAVLTATAEDVDPYFRWEFAKPFEAGLLSADIESDRAGSVQVFWRTADCPEFSEDCSLEQAVVEGRQTVHVPAGGGQPLVALRFDLAGKKGAVTKIHSIDLSARPRVAGKAEPRPEHTKAEPSPAGLVVTSADEDPWIILALPKLSATRATGIELEMDAAPSAGPWVFWEGGGCATEFHARCSAELRPKGAGRYGAELRGHAEWKGTITRLRLDPGDLPGRYVVKRVALVRGP
jgi:hypothetical protein